MSQQTISGLTAKFESTAARTSHFVSGTRSSCRNHASGQPGARLGGIGTASAKRTFRGENFCDENSRAVPKVNFWVGNPRSSPTVTESSPSPASSMARHSVAGPSGPPVKKRTGAPCISSATGSQNVPCADAKRQFCHGRLSAAASACTQDMPGSIRIVCPLSRGKTPRAPE